MKTLFLLVGAQGSGKSSQISKVSDFGFQVVRPSTTRAKRRVEDNDAYYFREEKEWQNLPMAWHVQIGRYRYGVEKTEIDSLIDGVPAVSLFHWTLLDEIPRIADKYLLDIVSVGIDTLNSVKDQTERLGEDTTRLATTKDFNDEISAIRDKADLLLTGDSETISSALLSSIRIYRQKGIITECDIGSMLKAGTLLANYSENQIEPSSYDLRLGNEVLCQGKKNELTSDNPHFQIPAYSYAVVKMLEEAAMPNFIVARYDTTVHLFFMGAILSNGLQVDPGYSGALFCSIFNPSDEPISISMNEHIATIEFAVTSQCTRGYSGHHQGKVKITDYIDKHIHKNPGGSIVEKISRVDAKLTSSIKHLWFAAGTVILALIITIFQITQLVGEAKVVESNIKNSIPKLKQTITDLNEARTIFNDWEANYTKQITLFNEKIGNLQLTIDNLSNSIPNNAKANTTPRLEKKEVKP